MDVFAPADAALAAGDVAKAQQQLLAILAVARKPDIIGAASMRLSHIAQLRGDLPAAEAPLRDGLKQLPISEPAARPALAAIYLQLGAIALARGDTSRAQLALMKGLAIGKSVAPTDPFLLEAELTLATAEIRAFRLSDAAVRLADLAPRLGTSSPRLTALYQSVTSELAFRQYDYETALVAQRKARDLMVAAYGANHPETARAETALGSGLFNAGQYGEAATMLQHAAAVYERDTAFYAPALAATLINLGQVYYTTGRIPFALEALDRAVQLARQSAGPDSQTEATALLHRGYAKLRLNDLAAAAADLRSAMAIWSKPTTGNQRALAGAGVWLAEADRRAGRLAEAADILDQSAAILTDIFGTDGYAVSDVLLGQAELALANSKPDAAIALLDRALTIRVGAVGPNHIASLDIRSMLATALAAKGDLAEARQKIAAVTEIVRQRIDLQSLSLGAVSIDEVEASRRLLGRHLAILAAAQKAISDDRADILNEAFAIGQLARASAAGQAVADLGLRQSLNNQDTAAALRQVQAATLRWQMAERALWAQVTSGAEADLLSGQERVEELRRAASGLSSAFAASHPAQAGGKTGTPATIADVRDVLLPNEALLSYLTLEDQTFLWVVTVKRVALVAIGRDSFWFDERIRALRATVNPKEIVDLSDILPFATGAAAELYTGLIAPASLTPDEEHLIIVPDGTLQSLPFATLLSSPVPAPEDFAGYRQMPWLIRDHDIAILPDIGALVALRKWVKPTQAKEPFLGIGDPALAGVEAKSANPTTAELLKSLSPLPEAADELNTIATALKAPPSAVITSAAANEAALKTLPLQNYRVIAFATHGLVAGDFGRLREPGLVLTPPTDANDRNDGLLTAGEIAELKLDADWVILSACNTAAADGTPGAEGLSGLARGFFFAGSRALLVSQWEVLSVAAVQLTTGALQHLARQPEAGKAMALRRAILDLMAPEQDDFLAHPVFWAPFELVGEGGAVR